MTEKMITVTFPAKKYLICTKDHGGYEEGFCFACGKYGWIDLIKHKEDCPVGKALGKNDD